MFRSMFIGPFVALTALLLLCGCGREALNTVSLDAQDNTIFQKAFTGVCPSTAAALSEYPKRPLTFLWHHSRYTGNRIDSMLNKLDTPEYLIGGADRDTRFILTVTPEEASEAMSLFNAKTEIWLLLIPATQHAGVSLWYNYPPGSDACWPLASGVASYHSR